MKDNLRATQTLFMTRGVSDTICATIPLPTIPPPLLNPIYRKQMQDFIFNVTFRRSVKEGKKEREEELQER